MVMHRTARRALQFPDVEIAPLDTTGLDDRDANLAGAIDHAVARRWLTLEAVIASRLSRPWEQVESAIRAVLLVGAAQLLLLDRVPDHAAINEAVEWTKRNVRPGAAGFVNAVLRRVAALRIERTPAFDPERRDQLPLSGGGAWTLHQPVFSTDAIERLSQQTSHPREVIERWLHQLGWEGTRSLAMHNLVLPPLIVTGLIGDGDAPEGFAAHEQRGFFVSEGPRADLDSLLASHPWARVQDPATAAACELTRGLSPGLIIDACAGRGTKTKQLAQLHPEARIITTDKDEARSRDLRAAFAGSSQVVVVNFDDLKKHAAAADLLVLDVPCSNSGVLARRVEAKYRLTRRSIEELVQVQRRIVGGALPLVKPGGHVLYATCSLEPAENAEQVAWMQQRHGLTALAAESRFPRGLPGDAAARYADGGYACLLSV